MDKGRHSIDVAFVKFLEQKWKNALNIVGDEPPG
jgi:hypothetical protein